MKNVWFLWETEWQMFFKINPCLPFAAVTNNIKLWMIPTSFPWSCFEILPFPYKLKPKGFQMRTKSLKELPGSLIHPSAPPHNLPLLPFTSTSSSNPVLAFTLQASLFYLLKTIFSHFQVKFPFGHFIPVCGNSGFQSGALSQPSTVPGVLCRQWDQIPAWNSPFFPNINSQEHHPAFQRTWTLKLGVIM